MAVRPIETFYNGYRFRSRLEARWAVFFDALGLAYHYEPEGFLLDDGTPYLPDFFLPAWHAWVEIKPSRVQGSLLMRYRLFQPPMQHFILLYGDVYAGRFGAWVSPWWRTATQPREFLFEQAVIHCCKACHAGWWIGPDRYGAPMLCLEACTDDGLCCGHAETDLPPVVVQAYVRARSARFEHGETPRGRLTALPPRPPRPSCRACGATGQALVGSTGLCARCVTCPQCHTVLDLATMRCLTCALCPHCENLISPETGLCPTCAHCEGCWGELLHPPYASS